MLKIPLFLPHSGAYVSPECEIRLLHIQLPVMTSFEVQPIQEEEEDWD